MLKKHGIIIILAVNQQPMSTISEPDVVTFCQIIWSNDNYIYEPEPPHAMLALAALKRLNFRVHPPYCTSIERLRVTHYLCEHMGEGIQWQIVQNALREIVKNTLISLSPRNFRSADNTYYFKWTCG
ncbi:unnamed protein product [Rotaria sp. Silwood1]|nr:unnamed protein product [Rotaria sp. Silwood1]